MVLPVVEDRLAIITALDDMRGASALKDAMRAVRMLNLMTKTDAEGVGIPEFERTSYFRVDRVKGNNAAPPSAATRAGPCCAARQRHTHLRQCGCGDVGAGCPVWVCTVAS